MLSIFHLLLLLWGHLFYDVIQWMDCLYAKNHSNPYSWKIHIFIDLSGSLYQYTWRMGHRINLCYRLSIYHGWIWCGFDNTVAKKTLWTHQRCLYPKPWRLWEKSDRELAVLFALPTVITGTRHFRIGSRLFLSANLVEVDSVLTTFSTLVESTRSFRVTFSFPPTHKF